MFQLVNYYNFKLENPAFFKDVNLSHLQRMGDEDIITVPPYRDQTGRRILLYRMGNFNSLCVFHVFVVSVIALYLELSSGHVHSNNYIMDLVESVLLKSLLNEAKAYSI